MDIEQFKQILLERRDALVRDQEAIGGALQEIDWELTMMSEEGKVEEEE